MIDIEMLELAAKAAGYSIESYTEDGAWVYVKDAPFKDGEPDIFLWRPRADDGDALRLAVKLEMRIDTSKALTVASTSENNEVMVFSDETGDDPYAATRLAIVRAAAEIGKTL